MADRKLEQDYARVLEASRARGEVLEEPAGQERRRHPRIRVQPGKLPAEMDPWVFAIDVSISGMAFYADEPVAAGERVTIALGELATAEVEVVGCDEVPPSAPHRPARHRLHCRFANEEEGMRLLVTIKDLEETTSRTRR